MTSATPNRPRCKQCGNELPSHGVCYICAQIERNSRRYGARPRPDYLGTDPRESDAAPALPPHVRNKIADRDADSQSQTPPRPNKETRRQASTRYLPAPYKAAKLRDVRAVRLGINRFLQALYRRPVLLSQLLADGGLSPAAIQTVRDNMDLYLNSIIKYWCGYLKTCLTDPQFQFFIRLYALDGNTQATEQELAIQYAVSPRHIQQAIQDARNILRTQTHSEALSRLAVDVARTLALQTDVPQKP